MNRKSHTSLLLALGLPFALGAVHAQTAADDGSPWGIASGAEWSGEYPKFNPLLRDAGVTWMRYFPEWQTMEPRKGEWNWAKADAFVADSRANGIQVAGVLGFAAKWATSDGSTRTVPLSDINDWANYSRAVLERYKSDISHWEVWNEFNGSFSKAPKDRKPAIYAELVRHTHEAAKAVGPGLKVGLTVANFDVAFLDATIRAGAAGHFEFLCVHPYENLMAVMKHGGEMGYLSLAGSLRKMLRDNGQDDRMPLWITEIGVQAPLEPDAEKDRYQADALVMCYVLSLAQGFDKVFWFEARGPAYGKGTDHGIIRADWTLRPAYQALRAMTSLLGRDPEYLGWLDFDGKGYGFVFQGAKEPVAVAWAVAGEDGKAKVATRDGMILTDPVGGTVKAGAEYTLSRSPVFLTGLPAARVEEARKNRGQNFPWGKQYDKASEVRISLAAENREEGIRQTKLGTTEVVQGLDWTARKSTNLKGGEGHYVYLRVDPTFAGFGDRSLEITAVVRRHGSGKPVGVNLNYESSTGYHNVKGGFQTIPEGEEWSEVSWKVDDANFVGAWGWNFRLDAGGSKGEYELREIRVKKP